MCDAAVSTDDVITTAGEGRPLGGGGGGGLVLFVMYGGQLLNRTRSTYTYCATYHSPKEVI